MKVVAHVPLQNDLHITEYDGEGNVEKNHTDKVTAVGTFVDATGTGSERVQGIKCLELDEPDAGVTVTKGITDGSFLISFWSRVDDTSAWTLTHTGYDGEITYHVNDAAVVPPVDHVVKSDSNFKIIKRKYVADIRIYDSHGDVEDVYVKINKHPKTPTFGFYQTGQAFDVGVAGNSLDDTLMIVKRDSATVDDAKPPEEEKQDKSEPRAADLTCRTLTCDQLIVSSHAMYGPLERGSVWLRPFPSGDITQKPDGKTYEWKNTTTYNTSHHGKYIMATNIVTSDATHNISNAFSDSGNFFKTNHPTPDSVFDSLNPLVVTFQAPFEKMTFGQIQLYPHTSTDPDFSREHMPTHVRMKLTKSDGTEKTTVDHTYSSWTTGYYGSGFYSQYISRHTSGWDVVDAFEYDTLEIQFWNDEITLNFGRIEYMFYAANVFDDRMYDQNAYDLRDDLSYRKTSLEHLRDNLLIEREYPSSDDRLKLNEVVIDGATDTLMKIRPQTYDKTRSIGGDEADAVKESGVIAQEVWYDCPELRHLVTVGRRDGESKEEAEGNVEADVEIPEDPRDDPDYSSWGPKPASVNYTGFIAYLIRGFQEQQREIQTLKEEIAALK